MRLGRHFLTLRGLARACLREQADGVRAELGAPALVRLVHHSAAGLPQLGPLLERRPGMAQTLLATLRDLRDAGVAPDRLPASSGALVELYRRFEARLDELRREGLHDRVGLFRLARRGVASWARRLGLERVEVHGAAELVGSAGDLIEALARVVPLRLLQPDWGDPYAAELRRSWPWSFEVTPQGPAGAEGPAGPPRVIRARSPHDEIERVAHAILAALEAGADPSQICVVSRAPEAYACWIHDVFERYGLPFSSHLSQPLCALPAVRSRLDLVRALVEDLAPGACVPLLSSARLRWDRLGASRAAGLRAAGLAERLARRGRVVRGHTQWSRSLSAARRLVSEEAEAPPAETVALLRHVLGELDRERTTFAAASGWAGAAEALGTLFERWLTPASSEPEHAEQAQVEAALGSLALYDRLDDVCERKRPPTPAEILRALEAEFEQARVVRGVEAPGGIRVRSALQARASRYDHLFLIGFQHGSWPLTLRDDPFLSAATREQLREATGRPLPVPRLRAAEDSFMLGLLLAQARRSVTLSWPEQDSAGRLCSASPYTSGLPFLACPLPVGTLEPDPLAARLATAGGALVEAARELGQDAAEKRLPELAAELGSTGAPALARGLELLRWTEDASCERLAYDGVVDSTTLDRARSWSPGGLELLGRCPLRAFFSRLLRVRDRESPPTHELTRRELGIVLHRVLRDLLSSLFSGGWLAAGSRLEGALEHARRCLPALVAESLGETMGDAEGRLEPIREAGRAQLEAAALDLLERELPALLESGVRKLELETRVELTLPAGRSGTLQVRGRADRILELGSGELEVVDYKTRADPSATVSRAEVRRGHALQIPLYVRAVAAASPGRSVVGRGVGVPLRPERDRSEARVRPRRISLDDAREWTGEALAVLTRLLTDGRFPFRSSDECGHCPYTISCRSGHAPSEERVGRSALFADYFQLQSGPK